MRFKAYGLSFRGKNAVFPLTLGRASLDASRFTFFKGETLHPPNLPVLCNESNFFQRVITNGSAKEEYLRAPSFSPLR